jgi:hypothetical protein
MGVKVFFELEEKKLVSLKWDEGRGVEGGRG